MSSKSTGTYEQTGNEDSPDEWEARINDTGCAKEQTAMNDCWFSTKDWRKCTAEVSAFKACWKERGNDDRTDTKDA